MTNSLTIASGDANAYSALSLTRQDREFIVMDDTSKKTTAMFKGGFKKDKWTLDGVATITSISTNKLTEIYIPHYCIQLQKSTQQLGKTLIIMIGLILGICIILILIGILNITERTQNPQLLMGL
ncbi:hypothetical protein ACFOEQ_13380 [Chryseobacterium arachidis]|uniref:hypothetical protein n=1 Tax=Chryseobacterium arachidis TaxID=1416778 RepID=UPI0036060AB9